EALRRMAEEADDPFDRLLHAEEIGEGGIDLDGAVHEDPAEARIEAGIDHPRLADRGEHPLRRACQHARVFGATFEISLEGHLYFALVIVESGKKAEKSVFRRHGAPRMGKSLYFLTKRIRSTSGFDFTC